MVIKDRLYGEIQIGEPVVIDLINSKPMQRLKKISQDGAPHYIQPIRNVNRFEHSIGVWYLSHLHRRPIEEQIAALLHDTPHTAFSHVIDVVVEDENHEFHDKFTEKIITSSEVPEILEKHSIKLNDILNTHKFTLLENELPDLSFDRWDYFMRDGTALGFLPQTLVNEFIKHVKSGRSTLYFTDKALAATFAILFMNFSRLIWLDPTSHGSFYLMAEAIKLALERKIITEDDYFSDDETLMKKLRDAGVREINGYLNRLRPGREFEYVDKKDAEFYGPNKPRYVDPLVEIDGKFERTSKLVPNLGNYFEEFSGRYKILGVRQLP
ncbi:HD domain-containing protein [candidate division WWE3 bacterium]|nr:HD domain-containing protein [candidate division WWE3 bacterium]